MFARRRSVCSFPACCARRRTGSVVARSPCPWMENLAGPRPPRHRHRHPHAGQRPFLCHRRLFQRGDGQAGQARSARPASSNCSTRTLSCRRRRRRSISRAPSAQDFDMTLVDIGRLAAVEARFGDRAADFKDPASPPCSAAARSTDRASRKSPTAASPSSTTKNTTAELFKEEIDALAAANSPADGELRGQQASWSPPSSTP